MNSWLLFWSSDWLIPAGHLRSPSPRVIELSLAECQVRGVFSLSRLCPGPSFMCPANGPGGIWGYVNNLMRSKVWESPLLSFSSRMVKYEICLLGCHPNHIYTCCNVHLQSLHENTRTRERHLPVPARVNPDMIGRSEETCWTPVSCVSD